MDSTSHQIMNPGGGEERTNMGDSHPLKVDHLIMDEATVSANRPTIVLPEVILNSLAPRSLCLI
jgi:hypothetical protein